MSVIHHLIDGEIVAHCFSAKAWICKSLHKLGLSHSYPCWLSCWIAPSPSDVELDRPYRRQRGESKPRPCSHRAGLWDGERDSKCDKENNIKLCTCSRTRGSGKPDRRTHSVASQVWVGSPPARSMERVTWPFVYRQTESRYHHLIARDAGCTSPHFASVSLSVK